MPPPFPLRVDFFRAEESARSGSDQRRRSNRSSVSILPKAVAACFLAAAVCLAGPEADTSSLVLRDLNNVAHQPLAPATKAGSILFFYWHDCPISNSYAPEMNRIASAHPQFACYIVQVDRGLAPAAAREHARQYSLRPPVLLDPKHRLVRAVKATVTPEAVVLGKTGRLLYRGRIDNQFAALGKKRPSATEHDLLEALAAVAAGKPVPKSETTAIGCLIQ
jgi:hypothetical protein